MVFTRGRSSIERLKIKWVIPALKRAAAGRQTAPSSTVSRADVLRRLSGKDKRPLLVMRECHQCEGTDLALLRRAGKNERTQLLTRWFQCVRLPATVRRKDHPAYALFAGDDAPHLYLSTADAGQTTGLAGNLPPSAVWKAMTKILRASYKSDPSAAVKGLLRVLDGLDKIDAQQASLRTQIERALESGGPKSARFKKLRAKFESAAKARKKLLRRENKLLDLKIK